jgi:hypothetical protein
MKKPGLFRRNLVSQCQGQRGLAHRLGSLNEGREHVLGDAGDLGQLDRDHLAPLEGYHGADLALFDQVHRGHTEAGGDEPVVGRGRPAALDVSQHHRQRGLPQGRLDGLSDALADGPFAQQRVAEGVGPQLLPPTRQ